LDRYIDIELYLSVRYVFSEKKFIPFTFHPFALNAKRSSFITIKISFLAFDSFAFYSSVNKKPHHSFYSSCHADGFLMDEVKCVIIKFASVNRIMIGCDSENRVGIVIASSDDKIGSLNSPISAEFNKTRLLFLDEFTALRRYSSKRVTMSNR